MSAVTNYIDNQGVLSQYWFGIHQDNLVHLDDEFVEELLELTQRQMNVREYYNLLEEAPWNYGDSEDPKEYFSGRAMIRVLKEIAQKNEWDMLFMRYENYAIHPMTRRYFKKPDCPRGQMN